MELSRSERDGGVVVLRATGRLNLTTAATFRSALADEVAAGRSRLVVDLGGLDFIDSSGLGAVISGLKSARQAGGDLRIAAPGEQVGTVLRLTNLDRVLRPHATVEDALTDW